MRFTVLMAKIGKFMLLKLQGKHCHENKQIADDINLEFEDHRQMILFILKYR